jgi:hemolysin III
VKKKYTPVNYPPLEEKWNVITHGIGLLFSFIAFFLLLIKASYFHKLSYRISLIIYGLSLIMLYAASTFYHAAKNPEKRKNLNIFDHASIYVLIAGSYTPFSLITLEGKTGYWLCGIIWSLALAGIILKLYYTGKFDKLSTLIYVFMGWLVLFAFKPLVENLNKEGLYWLISGGIFYTIGAFFYSFSNIKFNHAIFHVWVLAGSIAQFIAIYKYVS